MDIEQQSSGCFYLSKINAPNGNQQFVEYQNRKITDEKCIDKLFRNIEPTTDVETL